MALIAILGATIIPDVSSRISVKTYGAKGDGVTDDGPAFAQASAACNAVHGGTIHVPATGNMYLLNEGMTLGPGCRLEGDAGMNWGGPIPYDNNPRDWATSGSWIHCNDPTNPCVTMAGNGDSVGRLNFWWTQPTPTTTPGNFPVFSYNWTPTQWPYGILINGTFFWHLDNIEMVNASHCIDVEGDAGLGYSDFHSSMEHMYLGCFDVGTKWNHVDNAVTVRDAKYYPWWYSDSTDVMGYMMGDATHQGHKIDWDSYFVGGLQASDIQFIQSYIGWRINSATTGGVTIGTQDSGLTNVQFGSCQAIKVVGNTTVAQFSMNNIETSQSRDAGTQCAGATPIDFDLETDNLDLQVSNIQAYAIETLAAVGGGSSGWLHLRNYHLFLYSAFASGGAGIILNPGAILDPPGGFAADLSFNGAAGAGPKVSGGTPSNLTGFGSGASIVGSDAAGRITVGSTPGGSGTFNFWQTYQTAPVCTANDETTHSVFPGSATTTQVTFTGSMNLNDVIAYTCNWYA